MIRRTWPLLVSLAVSGGVAGTAIAGLPSSIPDAVILLAPSSVTNDGTGTGAGTGQVDGPATISSTAAPTQPVDAEATTSTVAVASEPPPVPTVSEPAAAVSPTTIVDTAGVDSGPTTAPSVALPLRHRAEIALTIANGDASRPGLAMQGAGRMSAAGYTQLDIRNDEVAPASNTTVYYRAGFAAEAYMVSGDLLMPAAPLLPVPDAGITGIDGAADIVIVLGADYVN